MNYWSEDWRPLAENRTPQDLPDDLRLGEVDASAASKLVLKYLTPWAARRVTTVGTLRAAGFRVVHSPTKTNRLHVSVYGPEQAEWDSDLAEKFNACFTEDEG